MGARPTPPWPRPQGPLPPAALALIALLLLALPIALFNQQHSGHPGKVRRELRKF